MGSTQSKEETIIAQTAAGDGKNSATANQGTGYSSISTTNILLTLIAIVLLAAACYAFCHFYKKMHNKWMERQMNRRSIRRRQTSVYFEKRAPRDGTDIPASIDEYGSELEQLFTDLTISQADGDSTKFVVLKPLNEKMAIKKFSDGLKNSRLSTIVAARNYDSLKDAIQGAKDEEVSTPSTSAKLDVMQFSRRSRGAARSIGPLTARRKHTLTMPR
uniref:Uncharacterized protein n=2 Tax=Heliothis virescens TaxID=7102 RepID=A0A2A4J5X7_HELVI